MRDSLTLLIWIFAAIFCAWFMALAINRYTFSNYDINPLFFGHVPLRDTDIGDQCGKDIASYHLIEYKLNTNGEIIYLCPQGLWPVQQEVVAQSLTQEFKKKLTAEQLKIISTYYPEQPAQPAASPAAFIPVPSIH